MFNVYRHSTANDHRDSVVPDLTFERPVHGLAGTPIASKEFTDGIVPEEERARCAPWIGSRRAHGAYGRRQVRDRSSILDG
jgi:hypothetical protein